MENESNYNRPSEMLVPEKVFGYFLGSIVLGFFGIVGFTTYKVGEMQKEIDSRKSQLEILADTDKDGVLSFSEKAKMYEMCGVADKHSTYLLTPEEVKKGLENYKIK